MADPEAATPWQQAHGDSGTADVLRNPVQARDALQDVVRGSRSAASGVAVLEVVVSRPLLSPAGSRGS
ncbi:hypothetical protein ABT288_33200 [Streptomyces sp. NPDC001093]|uniref:hypothetical protein n=1 Tax=Streptomyces sp. NPDC001093 TaxID=3154376 RepID=UPI00332A5279